MDTEQAYLSPRARKAQETREAFLNAAMRLVRRYGVESLTVRNICEEAGRSTGSFYNLFSGKEDLLAYYLKGVMDSYKKTVRAENEGYNFIEKCLHAYRYYAVCLKEAGVEFVTVLYSCVTNRIFNFFERNPKERLLLDAIQEYIQEGMDNGEVRADVSMSEALLRTAAITTGVAFYWCSTNGRIDLAYQMDDMLKGYYRSIASDPDLPVRLEPIPRADGCYI